MHRFLLLFLCLILSCCDHASPKSSHQLRIGISSDPTTLDPRKMRDMSAVSFAPLFFDGLTRLDQDGIPQLAVAKEFTVSPDQKTYTFKLRDSFWSNGDPVTAYDFENTWKGNLNPATASPNAYQLYIIKGAKEANEGKIPVDQVGIKATDASTLVIHLNQPTPYFLNLLATYFCFPVHPKGYEINNGPFLLKSWTALSELVAAKNPHYWDADKVKLSEIAFIVTDDNTALRMFEKGDFDWIGSPLAAIPPDAIQSLKTKDYFHITPAAATNFVRLNVNSPPLNDIKVRQALRDTIRRKELVEHILQANQVPAYSLVPYSFSTPLFQEQTLTSPFPAAPITLIYSNSERNHKIAQALQEQWRVNWGIPINLQSYESKLYLEKLKKGDFQMALGGWFADLSDPISYLEIFKDKNNGTNNTNWENPRYKNLLSESATESNPEKRAALLKEAEKILIEESPIIPVFHYTYNYASNPMITGVYFSDLGYIDFKNADIVRP